jgi:hypothetical protein
MVESRHHRLALVYTIIAAALVASVAYWQLAHLRPAANSNLPAETDQELLIDLGSLF